MNSRERRAGSLAALALLLSTPALQAADLYVGPSGSGAEFTQVSDALTVAVTGDTIHVAPGSYAAFTVEAGVTILGAGSASVQIQPSPGALGILIRNVAAGTEVTVSGMTLLEWPGMFRFVEASNNPGNVVLHDVVATGEPAGGFASVLVELRNSDHVVLDHCSFIGEDSAAGVGGIPLDTSFCAAVWISNSTLIGGATARLSSSLDALGGAPGLTLQNSEVFLAGSVVQGGRAGSFLSPFGAGEVAGGGGAGIEIAGGAAVLSGGPGNLVRGGDADPAVSKLDSYPGVALATTFFGTASYASDVILEGGAQLDGLPGPPLSGAAGAFDAKPYAWPTLSASSTKVAPGGGFDLLYSGNALSPIGAFFSIGSGPALPVGGVEGAFALDLLSTTVLDAGASALDASGLAAANLTVPALPALEGLVVFFQSVEVGAQATALSNPTPIVIDA